MAIPADLGDMLAAAAVAGYLLGSLPFGFLVARSRGVDIFQVGSRSPGATNVRRVLGRGPGNAVFVLDLLKGAVAAGWPLAWAYLVLAHESGAGHAGVLAQDAASREHMLGYVGLASALAGHSFSCFTGFRGGKGVATAAGGLLVLMPLVAIGSAAVWLVVFLAAPLEPAGLVRHADDFARASARRTQRRPRHRGGCIHSRDGGDPFEVTLKHRAAFPET